MTNLASALKAEIARVARREMKEEFEALRRATSRHRSEIATLKKQVLVLQRLTRKQGSAIGKEKAASAGQAAKNETVKLRFRASGFASLRKKLGLSAHDMGRLVGVSGQSIYHWEAGKTAPRASQLPAIAAVRKLGKREALEKLATVK